MVSLSIQCRSIWKPNILWITIEDLTPMLGCYGDMVAETPHIDRLASKGVRYTHAFAPAAVCSPARSCILTGLYAPTLGTQNLRSETKVPDDIIPFPRLLREKGYYCTNNAKEDYNFEVSNVWDESSNQAHWRNRVNNQPFFSVFNFETTHQSKIFGDDETYEKRFAPYWPYIQRTDPASVVLPPYSFDTPEIRNLWARYYDNVKVVDYQIGQLLSQLEEDQLSDQTVIFFYSDHGTGMPRGKRALYDSGLNVPLIVVAPPRFQKALGIKPNSVSDDLVSFVDLAPTTLSILDIPIPVYMQGVPFLGPKKKTRSLVFATSDRVDEAYECARTIRTKKFRYIRNYFPQHTLIQPNFYSDQSEINQLNQQLLSSGQVLTSAQNTMWMPRRHEEELYDCSTDPYEVNNLVFDPNYKAILDSLRELNRNQILEITDSGLIPEAYMYQISKGSTPYQTLKDSSIFPLRQILNLLDQLTSDTANSTLVTNQLEGDRDLLKYWTMIWIQSQDSLRAEWITSLEVLLENDLSYLSICGAETLARFGNHDPAINVILQGMQSDNEHLVLMATRAFELLPYKPKYALDQGREIWATLSQSTKGKWKGYDLYAYWSLCQIYGTAN